MNYRDMLFDRILGVKAAMRAATARDATRAASASAAPAQSPSSVLPPTAKAAPAHPAAPKEESAEAMAADCLARLYSGSGGGKNINHEFPPDVIRENWLATQNQPAPAKVTDAEFLHPLDQKAVAAAFEKQQATDNVVPFRNNK